MAPAIKDGWVTLPEAAGFGSEVEEAFVQRYHADREILPRFFMTFVLPVKH